MIRAPVRARTWLRPPAGDDLEAEIRGMRASAIQAELKKMGVRYDDCFEKEELVRRLAASRRKDGGGGSPPPKAGGSPPPRARGSPPPPPPKARGSPPPRARPRSPADDFDRRVDDELDALKRKLGRK